jgi:hypothetical protein
MLNRTELELAYRATTYRVYLPGGVLDLRIGQACEKLGTWLKGEGASSYAIISGFNPDNCLAMAEQNAEYQSQLECELIEGNYEPYTGENIPDEANAPLEESCFVADIELEDAVALAEDFGQNAIVFGRLGEAPDLIWIEQTE